MFTGCPLFVLHVLLLHKVEHVVLLPYYMSLTRSIAGPMTAILYRKSSKACSISRSYCLGLNRPFATILSRTDILFPGSNDAVNL